jgi:hypothetical protein
MAKKCQVHKEYPGRRKTTRLNYACYTKRPPRIYRRKYRDGHSWPFFIFSIFPHVQQYVFTIMVGACTVNQARPIIGVTALEPHFCFRRLSAISVVLDSSKS